MATTIRILPENLTNKIAAGEVVERPASVAKELVENAIDAGSKEVTVEIEGGGKKLIKVTDTGIGMSREDALLALERHATSKIVCDDDLFAISTLGFRGEALPSIASVSRLSVCTRRADTLEGTEIYAEGGRIKEVKECGMASGTVISVRNLFFNTPARLKFMKSPETEGGHVGELLTRLAISRPDVRFTYINDGKTVFRVLDTDLKERVSGLLGRPLAASLYPVDHAEGAVRIRGLVAAPELSRSAASHLYTYINGRFIRDKVVQHAIMQAYRNFLERGRYPVLALFLEIDPGEVDVNVHPTKHEVRFREQGRVHDTIQRAVEGVLSATPWLKRAPQERPVGVSRVATSPAPAAVAPLHARTGSASGGAGVIAGALTAEARGESESKGALQREVVPAPQLIQGAAAEVRPTPASASEVSAARVAEVRELLGDYTPRTQKPSWQDTPFVPPVAARPLAAPPVVAARAEEEVADDASRGYFSSLSVIGQFNAAYIVCQCGSDMVLVDQHAAHERVAFERLKKEFATRQVETQGLLFPETLELSFRESAALSENVAELEALGFSLEEFGGNTWILKGVPQILAGGEYLRTVRDIVEELANLGRSRTFTDIKEDILAKVACHSVVRGRSVLTQQEITALFTQMDRTDFSSNCPHGRPVMQKLTLTDVEKMFKRQ
ncbi:DNA mismatch repair endonuclease MutL [Geomonas sp. RF6]|uniref:DNA mismatch repair endonuclease MutL n=1 Tax=Geomonas sp. RF6 TaxID=2897342 RepID=UPI001E5327EC|nr:DNA mismatch repair endonuclease MutL [Geomonas sp. RF6]UFS69047.1 DNA mismatch repair endonuclease MutL [Geomonas sp. RF6]